MHPERALERTRRLIDAVDAGLLLLLAARRRLVGRAARCKHASRLPASDPVRERQIQHRALRLAAHLGLPAATARAQVALAIADARACQGLSPDAGQGGAVAEVGKMPAAMNPPPTDCAAPSWLGLLPPPARWAAVLRRIPPRLQRDCLERGMGAALTAALEAGALEFLQGRRLGIEVQDLGLCWVVTLEGRRLRVVDDVPEATVRGDAADLLLLAGRLEDADTLFFQRRLVLVGDTELGLTARNVLDRLPWEQVPLALRIVLNRGARLARAARQAYHGAARRRSA